MIRLEQVSRRWPEFAIRDVTIDVKEGHYLVIVGPTGAGKTLLLELLLGIHKPDSGRILIDGKDVTGMPPEQRKIGMVYQDYLLFPHLSVEQNLAFGLRYQRPDRHLNHKSVQETARLLGIDHLLHRYPHNLSGGEKQRVALGRALVTEPHVLLLDEPLAAVDRNTAGRLRNELKSLHRSKGLTILHVTHDLSEARQMGDSIALINGGGLHAKGTADELFRSPATLFAANFVGAVNLYEAKVEKENGEMRVVAGPLAATPFRKPAGAAHIMVLPDEVALLPDDPSMGPGFLRGEITGLTDEGHYVAVAIRIGGLRDPLIAYASRQSLRSPLLRLSGFVMADVRNAMHVICE